MASPELLDQIAVAAKDYLPNEAVQVFMSGVELATVSGPTASGKDTLIRGTMLPAAKGVTSRKERPHDPTDLYDHLVTDAQRRELLDDLRQGELVQAHFIKATGTLYGSYPRHFDSSEGVVMVDVTANEYAKFKREGLFKSVRGSYLALPSLTIWDKRLNGRGQLSPADHADRMAEGEESLELGLARDDLYFILNDDLAMATVELRDYALFGIRDQDRDIRARSAARQLLAGLRASQAAW